MQRHIRSRAMGQKQLAECTLSPLQIQIHGSFAGVLGFPENNMTFTTFQMIKITCILAKPLLVYKPPRVNLNSSYADTWQGSGFACAFRVFRILPGFSIQRVGILVN